MRRKNLLRSLLITVTAFIVMSGFVFLSTPLNAMGAGSESNIAAQETVVPIDPEVDPEVEIVPDTGQQDTFWTSWLFWVLIGAIVLALIIAVISRAAAPPAVYHDHTHDDDRDL